MRFRSVKKRVDSKHCGGNIRDGFADGMACQGITADGGEGAWLGSSGYTGNPKGTVRIGSFKR